MLVRDDKAPDEVTDRGATHIIKAYDSGEYPELAANELLCTHGAAAAGIETARVTLTDNRRFLIADRFDRLADGTYLGVEDFCVLNGLRAHGRYTGSYEGPERYTGVDLERDKKLSHTRFSAELHEERHRQERPRNPGDARSCSSRCQCSH